MYTILYKSVYSGVIYTFSMIWITFAIYISNEGDYSTLNKVRLDIIISIIILITGLIAILQQNDIIKDLPGITWVNQDRIRPSSITGSYLHYPLVISTLSIILLQIGISLNKKKYISISLIGIVLTITS